MKYAEYTLRCLQFTPLEDIVRCRGLVAHINRHLIVKSTLELKTKPTSSSFLLKKKIYPLSLIVLHNVQ